MWFLPTVRAALAALFQMVRDDIEASLRVKWRQPRFRGALALSFGAAAALVFVAVSGVDEDAVTESRAAVFAKEASSFGQGTEASSGDPVVGAEVSEGDLAVLSAVPDREPLAMAQLMAGWRPSRAQSAVAAGLSSDGLADRRVAALAAPFAPDAIAVLPRLLELGASKDPRLAPVAVAAVHEICKKLTRDALWAQEHGAAELQALRPALTRLSKDSVGRADLRVASALCLTRLDALAPSAEPTAK